MADRKNPFLDTATTMGKLVGFLVVSLLCGVLVAGLMVPTVAVAGSAPANLINAADKLPDQLKIGAPAQATKVLASDGSLIANIYFQNRTPVELDAMSPFIKKAVVAIEDERYYQHGGVDPTGLIRALVASASGQRQGASTITQQYVNNVIFQTLEAQGRTDEVRIGAAKGVADKIREIMMAVSIEKQYSKDDILKGYLNIVNFGNGTYGVQAASQYYFKTDAKNLTLPQAALLAGTVNSPGFYDPVKNPQNARARRNEVLSKMLQQGMIQKPDYDAAVATPVEVTQNFAPNGCMAAPMAPFFCDYIKNIFLNNPDYGETRKDRERFLTQGGLTIKTTLDPKAQNKAQEQVDNTMSPQDMERLNRGAALVSVEPGTGKVRAMAQNFAMSPQKGPGKTSYNFSVPGIDSEGNRLGGLGTMQVGSTLKPFTFASWLDDGKPMNALLNGAKRDYPSTFKWTNSCGTTMSNFDRSNLLQNDGNTNYQTMTVLRGLVRSVNTITFASAAQLDFCKIQKMTEFAGLRQGTDGKPLEFDQAANLLGVASVAPMTMANAFATFANKGTYCAPTALESVTTPTGKNLPVPATKCEQKIKPEVANGVMYALKQVLSDRSGSGALIRPAVNQQFDIGAKTGTTNYGVDTWVVGTTSGLATASWFGNPTGNLADPAYRNQDVTIKGKKYTQLDGSGIAGTAFSNYMNAIAPTYKTEAFPQPPQSMISGQRSQRDDATSPESKNLPSNNLPNRQIPPVTTPPTSENNNSPEDRNNNRRGITSNDGNNR